MKFAYLQEKIKLDSLLKCAELHVISSVLLRYHVNKTLKSNCHLNVSIEFINVGRINYSTYLSDRLSLISQNKPGPLISKFFLQECLCLS